ncbi:hypothetical protein BaRGS_00036544 [Batillaria attramentaria]|uniref:Uncharacterized protein n=1 Tax=Batillaria attramentaria TaxID=370345 RepID=A0ABD0JBS6_9CAEN
MLCFSADARPSHKRPTSDAQITETKEASLFTQIMTDQGGDVSLRRAVHHPLAPGASSPQLTDSYLQAVAALPRQVSCGWRFKKSVQNVGKIRFH